MKSMRVLFDFIFSERRIFVMVKLTPNRLFLVNIFLTPDENRFPTLLSSGT